METGESMQRKFRFCPACGSSEFVTNNEKSKRCGACGFVYYENAAAATVAVIRNDRGELLAVRRACQPAKGTLDLPGGFCDCGETCEQGVRREVMEETGLEVTEIQFLFSVPNVYPYCGLNVHTADLFFLCHVADTQPAVAMDDAAELMWIPIEQVRAEDFGLHSIRSGVEKLLNTVFAHK